MTTPYGGLAKPKNSSGVEHSKITGSSIVGLLLGLSARALGAFATGEISKDGSCVGDVEPSDREVGMMGADELPGPGLGLNAAEEGGLVGGASSVGSKVGTQVAERNEGTKVLGLGLGLNVPSVEFMVAVGVMVNAGKFGVETEVGGALGGSLAVGVTVANANEGGGVGADVAMRKEGRGVTGADDGIFVAVVEFDGLGVGFPTEGDVGSDIDSSPLTHHNVDSTSKKLSRTDRLRKGLPARRHRLEGYDYLPSWTSVSAHSILLPTHGNRLAACQS